MVAGGVVLSAAVLATACSNDTVTTLDNTVATEAPARPTAPVSTSPVQPSTAPSTLPPATSSSPPSSPAVTTTPPTTRAIPTLPADPEIQAMADAVLAADAEYSRQLWNQEIDQQRLLEVMTPRYANATVRSFQDLRQRNRRFERGSINEQRVLRIIRVAPTVAQIVLCIQDNDAEFDTRGTPQTSDDELIQQELGTAGYLTQVRRIGNRWLLDGSEPDDQACSAAFS